MKNVDKTYQKNIYKKIEKHEPKTKSFVS